MLEKKGLKAMTRLVVLGAVMLLAVGCSSSAVKYGSARISSRPEGAEVINLKDESKPGGDAGKRLFRRRRGYRRVCYHTTEKARVY